MIETAEIVKLRDYCKKERKRCGDSSVFTPNYGASKVYQGKFEAFHEIVLRLDAILEDATLGGTEICEKR